MALAKGNKIKFLYGLSSKLKNTTVTSENIGTFFLTTDTHHLYVGLEANQKPFLLNENVVFLATATKPPENAQTDRLYFIQDKNALCTWDGQDYLQINPDSILKSATTYFQKNSNNNSVDFGFSVSDTSTTDGHSVSSNNLTFKGTGNITISVDDEAKDDNGKTLGYKTIHFNVPAGDTFTLSGEDVIDNNKSKLGVDLKLTSGSGTNDSDIAIKNGSYTKIAMNGDDAQLDSADFRVSKFEAASGSTELVDGTPIKTNKGFTFTVEQTDKDFDVNVSRETSIDPIITLKDVSVHFKNGTADLSSYVYTKDEITALTQGLDAMTYCGTFSNIDDLATKTPGNGDVWKFIGDAQLSSSLPISIDIDKEKYPWIETGDLFIAHGDTENEKGQLTGTWNWQYIPSGNDLDTTYKFGVGGTTPSITLKEKGRTDKDQGTIEFQANRGLKVTGKADTNDNSKEIITYGHENSGYQIEQNLDSEENLIPVTEAYNTDNESLTFTADNLTIDTYGHVTGGKKTTYVLKDTHNKMKSGETTVTSITDGVSVTNTFTMKDGDSASSIMNITSKTLTLKPVSNQSTNLSMELVWGTFGEE